MTLGSLTTSVAFLFALSLQIPLVSHGHGIRTEFSAWSYTPMKKADRVEELLPELSPKEKALADALGPYFTRRVIASLDWQKKGGWRPYHDDLDLDQEIKLAAKSYCSLIGLYDICGRMHVELIVWRQLSQGKGLFVSKPSVWGVSALRATAWFPSLPAPPAAGELSL